MLGAILLAIMAQGAAESTAVVDPALVEPDPKAMSQKEIRAFNSQLPRNHPYYIRCVSSPEVGSLVKKTYSCRTNRQWKIADETGNQNARDTYEAMTSKSWNTGN